MKCNHYARGIQIQVSVYDDPLYTANRGRLPENWSVKKLMEKHSSEPFNPNIAHVYYLAGFIESWGRGIEKICQACREDFVPLSEYDITGNSVMIYTSRRFRLWRHLEDAYTLLYLYGAAEEMAVCCRRHYAHTGSGLWRGGNRYGIGKYLAFRAVRNYDNWRRCRFLYRFEDTLVLAPK